MTQYSFPWNDVHGDRLYDADDFMRFFAAFLKTGIVMSFKDGLLVRSTKNGMNIQVESGSAVINGGSYLNDKSIGIQVNVASSIQDRVDSVVLRMDKNARTTQLFYKPGDTTVARNDTTYELQLAKISVKTNATKITDADITDMRSDSAVCGWSTPFDNINVDGIVDQYKEIFSQADVQFQKWFKNLKNQLDDKQASNLQNQIDNLGIKKADEDKVVHNTGDETIAGIKTFQDPVNVKDLKATGSVSFGRTSQAPWATAYFSSGHLNFTRIGNLVFVMGWANTKSIPGGTIPATPLPSGFKPKASLGTVRLVSTEGHKYEIGTDGKLTFKTTIPDKNSFTPMTACFITDDVFPA